MGSLRDRVSRLEGTVRPEPEPQRVRVRLMAVEPGPDGPLPTGEVWIREGVIGGDVPPPVRVS